MRRTIAGFDWDERNRAKCLKHGVSIAEIEALLRGEPHVAPDPRHSAAEDRFIAVGRNAQGRALFEPSPSGRGMASGSFAPSARATCTGRRSQAMKRKVPRLTTDAEAEAFLEQDLSDLDFTQFKPVRFEFEKKSARVNMRLPQALLDAVKARAQARGIPYQRLIREALEQAVAGK
jgi:predicted DNA binding CopG/RHH family protein